MNFTMFKFTKTLITFFLWGIISLFFTLICIPFVLLPEKIRFSKSNPFFFLGYIWNKLLILSSFLKIKVINQENLPSIKTPSIIIANHCSALDIFLLEALIGNQPHFWISKDTYAKIPLFNIIVKRMHIFVKRDDSIHSAKAFVKILQLMKTNSKHLLLFPEGKRFNDGKIHDFMPGVSLFAKKLNLPVIPILIKGTNKIFPKKSFLIDSTASEVKLIVGKPFYYKNESKEEDFVFTMQEWFTQTLDSV
ncbi:hypothetical protein GF322_02950 [Candidatus Dependentiae bacterium]|nr:hypothetical protein [Candidatus Dependentiae bacterium]